MKKKEIEKIPFRGGVRADKQYRNTAIVFLQDIRGESHLFVEVYENKKRELQTPWIRMVFTQKDWGLYYPDANCWSAAGLDDEKKRSAATAKKETTSVIWLGPREIWCGSLLEIRGDRKDIQTGYFPG